MKSSKQYSNADKESLIGAAVWVDAKKCDRLHIFFHTDSCNHHFSDLAYKHCPAVIHLLPSIHYDNAAASGLPGRHILLQKTKIS